MQSFADTLLYAGLGALATAGIMALSGVPVNQHLTVGVIGIALAGTGKILHGFHHYRQSRRG